MIKNQTAANEDTQSASESVGESARASGSSWQLLSEMQIPKDDSRLAFLLWQVLDREFDKGTVLASLQEVFSRDGIVDRELQERWYRVLATTMRTLGDDVITNRKQLCRLADLTDSVISACKAQPSRKGSGGLQEILRGEISLLTQLEGVRELFIVEQRSDRDAAQVKADPSQELRMLYLNGLKCLASGMDALQSDYSQELIDEGRELLKRQLSWVTQGHGPVGSQSSYEAHLWVNVCRFARLVADDSHEAQLTQVIESIVGWYNQCRELGLGTLMMTQSDPLRGELRNIAAFIREAGLNAMRALVDSQRSYRVKDVWIYVSEAYRIDSVESRVALLGLARADVDETECYVADLLNMLALPNNDRSEVRGLLHSLVLLAAEPAMHSIITEAVSPWSMHPIEARNRGLLLSCIRGRLQMHYASLPVTNEVVSNNEANSPHTIKSLRAVRSLEELLANLEAW